MNAFLFGTCGLPTNADPLAGLILDFRLQTHTGDGVPVSLFQDTACTIAAEVGDTVLGTQFTGRSIETEQPVGTKGPVIVDDGGVPALEFDGIDDWLPLTLGVLGGSVTYTALFKANTATFGSYWGLIEGSNIANYTCRWGFFGSGSTNFHNDPSPASVVREGVTLSAPFSLSPINQWQVVTVTTANGTAELRGIGQLEQQYFGNFRLIALIMHDPADTATVAAYLQTLKPTEMP